MESWREMVAFPLTGRSRKPRTRGLTMVLDKGLGLGETKDLLDIAGDHVDLLKLGFGTSALYGDGILQEKINLVRRYGIDIYPGGTFMEVAIAQGRLLPFLRTARQLGFTAVEVSDGTLFLDAEVRREAIILALENGFKVLTEVGKKHGHPNCLDLARQAKLDIKAGASWVIVEGREFGRDVTVYDGNGRVREELLALFLECVEDQNLIIWEAPLKDQQEELIVRFGPDVNLGNIAPQELLSLEALRVGLRGDTLRRCYQRMV
ncbi:phosphosulfolactate synthase [Candidatus Desulforudis audaxviator]|uniref:Phosphosulfolactate synthase n=1 Tax=Desulforudis audaxviator (strain MP104C) TaxID=477974 RepID=B1I4G7_DESAP|nr:phosphosulfolactate synthase [Candidatus Desulforudis audaxviator]ACA59820.1 Phosphosulfolactate synthase [Candidatus Desulforudis audaxviator MP104C]AZK59823.1 Phosphosulfolactate synthase [Candidatus Desulforudis audaxviator]